MSSLLPCFFVGHELEGSILSSVAAFGSVLCLHYSRSFRFVSTREDDAGPCTHPFSFPQAGLLRVLFDRFVEDLVAGFELEGGPSFFRELGSVCRALRGCIRGGWFGSIHLQRRRRRWVSRSASNPSSRPRLPFVPPFFSGSPGPAVRWSCFRDVCPPFSPPKRCFASRLFRVHVTTRSMVGERMILIWRPQGRRYGSPPEGVSSPSGGGIPKGGHPGFRPVRDGGVEGRQGSVQSGGIRWSTWRGRSSEPCRIRYDGGTAYGYETDGRVHPGPFETEPHHVQGVEPTQMRFENERPRPLATEWNGGRHPGGREGTPSRTGWIPSRPSPALQMRSRTGRRPGG